MNLQPLKIPRGYRGDWPVQEYALIDAVESVITEVELARGSNASLAEELEETYATKTYVQLAVLNPNVNDIYVSDLSVKVSEQGKQGYSLQVNGAGSLVFANTYELGNGTLAAPSLYFSDNVDAGIFVNYSTSVEDFNIKVASGIIAKFSHNKISGENTLIFGNLQLSSGGDISGIRDLTSFRRLVTTGTGVYRSEFAEIYAPTITLNTLQANNFGKILDLGVVNANTLVSDTIYGKCAAGSTNLPEANAGYISQWVRGAGDLMQEYLSESTGYLYRRVKIGGTFGTWTKFAKSVGDSSIKFSVASGVASNDAVNKGQLDSAVSTLQTAISNEATARSNADTALQTAISNEATARSNADTALQTAINNLTSSIMNKAWPIGSVYENRFDPRNPSHQDLLGFGTWATLGDGRVTVGYQYGDPDFGTVGQTGGNKGHKMTSANLIAHTHTYQFTNRTGTEFEIGAEAIWYANAPSAANTGIAGQADPDAIPTLPPYIVVVRWVRTA